jgi:molecular chaperone DnaK
VIQIGGTQKSEPIIGIDLGTTNSLVGYVRNGVPEILSTREGKRLVPSVVSFSDEGIVIGHAARTRKVTDAATTAFSVKRLLGRGFQDLEEVRRQLPYEIVPGEGGVPRVRLGKGEYTAIEISAMILRELRLGAEQALGERVTKAVVTVPAYFNDSQRQATRTAGRLAGLDVLRIINEPTAASLAYGIDKKKQGVIAVYDLGGGTFDLSILRLHDGIFEVLATHGDTQLGGDDLDQAIALVSAAEIRSQFGLDAAVDLNLKAQLLESAERVKMELSEKQSSQLTLTLSNGQTYSRNWSREEFEALAQPIVDRTREPCLKALADAGLSVGDISDVVLVGGPTRLEIVQKTAESIFQRKPNTSVHPDEVVALGAAIQGDILAGKNRELLLLDVVPLSLGLETYGGVMSTLIARNTKIPAVAREHFTTFVDNQTGVDLHVLQGERERVEDNRSLARFKLKGLEPSPAGAPRIEVTFLIDADGILNVAAKDIKTGSEQVIEVRPSFGLTDKQVEQMLGASAENAESDIAYRKLVEARNAAEPVLRAAEKRLPDAERLLAPEEVAAIRVKIEELKHALGAGDPAKISDSKERLNTSTVHLAELVVKEIIASRGSGSSS